MRLLLDTHALLWFLREPDKLPSGVLKEIEASEDCSVSIASLWEIAIKVSINKLQLPKSFGELFPQSIHDSGLRLLPIESSHIAIVSQLPFHHRDPFDRMIVAQAQVENLTVATIDPEFNRYGVATLW